MNSDTILDLREVYNEVNALLLNNKKELSEIGKESKENEQKFNNIEDNIGELNKALDMIAAQINYETPSVSKAKMTR